MRDLLTDPACQPADLGCPLPDSLHAVSVAMPSWQDVIDYEEGRPALTAQLRAGYPRFFCHPKVTELFAAATAAFASDGEGSLVFPSEEAAGRCRDYVGRRSDAPVRLNPLGPACAVTFPEPVRPLVREFWRYCGDTLSSRMAVSLLANPAPPSPADAATGDDASRSIRERLAHLHGIPPDFVFLFPSGMAAIAAAHRLVTAPFPGLPTVQLDFPYVDALKIQQECGSGVHFFPLASPDDYSAIRTLASQQKIAAVFCEMPSNPLLHSVRLRSFAPTLRSHRIPLIIDDTVASAAAIAPLRHADLVTTSLTKSFSGEGDVLAGALILNPDSPHAASFLAALQSRNPSGNSLWWEDAAALEKNSRDFSTRIHQSHSSAAALAATLAAHPAVASVWYPRNGDGLDEILRPGAGRGCLFSFALRNPASTPAVYNALPICKGPSLGTNFSLCCPYTLLAHYLELDWAQSCGVPSHLLRVSVGLEPLPDLIDRFLSALARA
jgi:cystathionine gamma-synthase